MELEAGFGAGSGEGGGAGEVVRLGLDCVWLELPGFAEGTNGRQRGRGGAASAVPVGRQHPSVPAQAKSLPGLQ